jgi:starch phosphorylase
VDQAARILDPDTLTLGFARRFATYKRPTLLLQDPERLVRLLTNPHRPVQLLLAGKAHPADEPGQALIRQWTDFIRRRPDVRPHVVFLPDYDMLLTEQLVHGVDVWINNPRRPWEACGTSGMKVLVNGGINLSELDGWWAEAYEPGVGWAIRKEHVDDPQSDAAEAEALYTKLEQEIVPLFYYRDTRGFPVGWISHVRESMARLTPEYSADRAVREYTEKYYLPAARVYGARAAEDGASVARLLDWQHALAEHWTAVQLSEMKVETSDGQHSFQMQVHLGELSPDSVCAELYADALPGGPVERHRMSAGQMAPSGAGNYVYNARVPATRSASDYTARIIPCNPEAIVPLEASQILWQR